MVKTGCNLLCGVQMTHLKKMKAYVPKDCEQALLRLKKIEINERQNNASYRTTKSTIK